VEAVAARRGDKLPEFTLIVGSLTGTPTSHSLLKEVVEGILTSVGFGCQTKG
jgi:hypothetical protein